MSTSVSGHAPRPAPRSVRDAAYDVLREVGATTVFGNPGTTEIDLLAGFPEDFRFVLCLQEAGLVGMASGHSIGSGRAALALVHTAAGLGNAVSAIATARENGIALVTLVGQQDRDHLASHPFLTGRLRGMAGEYPLETIEPARPQDVPAAIRRAFYKAEQMSGPVVLIVPMGDWLEPFDGTAPRAAPQRMALAATATVAVDKALLRQIAGAARPAIVVGALNDSPDNWAAVTALVEAWGADFWQDTFAAQIGGPQNHARYRGILPAAKSRRRDVLDAYDVVLVIGAPAFRGLATEPGGFTGPGTRVFVVTSSADDAMRADADCAILGPISPIVQALLAEVPGPTKAQVAPRAPMPAAVDDAIVLNASNVVGVLSEIVPADCVVFEEAPSLRHQIVNGFARSNPRTFYSAAMGGLGFAVPAALGVKLADPERDVAAIVGDGSLLYTVQSLWTARRYRIGATIFVLTNGGYAVMDRQAEARHCKPVWPGFPEISVTGLSESLGCPAMQVTTAGGLRALRARFGDGAREREPLLVEVVL